MMNRRTFVSNAAIAAGAVSAGCLGGDGNGGDKPTDDGHLEAMRTAIDDRGVEFESVELDDGAVAVEHGYDDDPNDAIANVAMAFVERISGEWDVDRLEGLLRDEGTDWTWHAEAGWAQAYADGEIDPGEYGSRISETMSMASEGEREDDPADGDD